MELSDKAAAVSRMQHYDGFDEPHQNKTHYFNIFHILHWRYGVFN